MVREFFVGNSIDIPDKKYAGKHVLESSVENLHRSFISSSFHISRSAFHKLRPKNCITVDRIKFITCLCEYCVNVDFILKGLRQIKDGSHTIPKDKFELVNLSLCEKESKYHDLDCIQRNCSDCGVKLVKDALGSVSNASVKLVKWQKWTNCVVTNKSGTVTKKKSLQENCTDGKDVLNELCTQLQTFAEHLFFAKWQREVFNKITNDPPSATLVSVVDFAENYKCVHQFEAASMYYSYTQVTIHPAVCFYRCPDCEEVVTHSIACITADLGHDSDAVAAFTSVECESHIQFSDGCGPQYKSKRPFLDISKRKKFQRNFFGSRHGKNLCDAFGGLIKRAAEKYVKTSKGNIRNAEELHQFCVENLEIAETGKCDHSKRSFLYFEDIPRVTGVRQNLSTLPGTHKVHCVQSTDDESGEIQFRNLSCFCAGCLNNEACINVKYVKPFKNHSVENKQSASVKKGRMPSKDKCRSKSPNKKPNRIEKNNNPSIPRSRQRTSNLNPQN